MTPIILVLIILFSLLVQFSAAGWINPLLILVIIWAALRGAKEGLIIGFSAGLLADLLTANLFILSVTLMLLGGLVGYLKHKIIQTEKLYIIFFAWIGTCWLYAANLLLVYLLTEKIVPWAWFSLIFSACSNSWLAYILTPLGFWLNQKTRRPDPGIFYSLRT